MVQIAVMGYAYCSFPQWEILAFAADVALRRRECI